MNASDPAEMLVQEVQAIPALLTGYVLEFCGLIIFAAVLGIAIRSFFSDA